MREPTPEQEAILRDTSRIRVVRATPGSGKTWLVAELIRHELQTWDTESGQGVAALSFTRVGGDEIRRAVGYVLDHPHFVGTIDAFLFRYVIRPFLRACFPELPAPRLIPGEWGAEHWHAYGTNAAMVAQGVNLFGCVFVGEQDGTPMIAHTPHAGSGLQLIRAADRDAVLAGKRRMWRQTGCLTHSDAALWACMVLAHPALGLAVRRLIVNRFPLLIVDELQDTGYFLGRCMQLLLEVPHSRGVLVGDPDQAIFEFSGARPELFAAFEAIGGAVTLQLGRSLRCPQAVVQVARHVKDTGGDVVAAAHPGRAVLVHCADPATEVRRIAETIQAAQAARTVKVVARSRDTAASIEGRASRQPQRLGSPPLFHMTRAVAAFRQGRQARALAGALAAISRSVFGYEGTTKDDLAARGVDDQAWKEFAVRCLLRASTLDTDVAIFDWQEACGQVLEDELAQFGLDHPDLGYTEGRLHPEHRGDWALPARAVLPDAGAVPPLPADVSVDTVHGVKGETHDVTVLVSPRASAAHCISRTWWADDRREERRIAYVAMTRTRGDLILLVSTETLERLRVSHPEFLGDLDCLGIDEFVTRWLS